MEHVASVGPCRIVKEDHAGRVKVAYDGDIVHRDESVVVARCPWSHPFSVDLGPYTLGPGDVFYEYYYAREWFNIYRIHDAVGRLKGWYCNVSEPAAPSGDSLPEIRWRDLALDLLVLPDGETRLLDEDEFEALDPSPALRRTAAEALNRLRTWAREGHPPFQALGSADEDAVSPPGGAAE